MVIVLSGVFMILMGMLGKIGAIFATIPTPVLGGMFLIMFGVITAAGISNLQVNHSMKYDLILSQIVSECFAAIQNLTDTSHFTVHRHEFLQEYICFWFFHVFCTCHSKLDNEESRFLQNRYNLPWNVITF